VQRPRSALIAPVVIVLGIIVIIVETIDVVDEPLHAIAKFSEQIFDSILRSGHVCAPFGQFLATPKSYTSSRTTLWAKIAVTHALKVAR
jgi:hypothetical protein